MKKQNLIRIKEELNKWKIELINKLSVQNNNDHQKFIFIDKEWLNNFEKNFLSKELTDSEIKQKKEKNPLSFNSMKLIIEDKLYNCKLNLPDIEIFVLNESCLNAFQTLEGNKKKFDRIVGYFHNKLLLLELDNGNDKNSKIICLFFLDDNKNLRQAYLKPLNNNNSFEIKYEFEKYEPLEIFKKYGITIGPSKIIKTVPKFTLFIFKSEIKEQKKQGQKVNIINIEKQIPSHNKNNNKLEETIKQKIRESWETNKISFNNLSKNRKKPNNIQNNDKVIIKKFVIKNKQQQIKLKKNIRIKEYIKEKQKAIEGLEKKIIDNNNKFKKEIIPKQKSNNTNKEVEINPPPIKKIKIIEKEKKDKKEIINNDKNIIEGQEIPDIIEDTEYSDQILSPILIGLQNIGATCYMNATLQCFSHIDRLKYYLLDEYIYNELLKEKDTTKKLSFAFAEVLKNLYDENSIKKYYAPEHFKQVISEMNPLFQGIAANDSKDLIIFMLEKMHNELNTKKGNNIINNQVPNPCDFNAVYLDFINDYQNQNDSIITQEFYGFNNIISSCSKCTNIIHNVQTYNILIFPLEEVRKFKNYNENKVSIMDCFDYNQKTYIYPSYYCIFCRENCPTYSQTRLVDTPKTLIIILNRGRGLQFNVDIAFDQYLDIKNYVYNQQSPYYYELVGMLCHYGTNDMGGHFIAFCKDSTDGNWYKFNDAIVSSSSFEEVRNSGMPYVLFYSFIQV